MEKLEQEKDKISQQRQSCTAPTMAAGTTGQSSGAPPQLLGCFLRPLLIDNSGQCWSWLITLISNHTITQAGADYCATNENNIGLFKSIYLTGPKRETIMLRLRL